MLIIWKAQTFLDTTEFDEKLFELYIYIIELCVCVCIYIYIYI